MSEVDKKVRLSLTGLSFPKQAAGPLATTPRDRTAKDTKDEEIVIRPSERQAQTGNGPRFLARAIARKHLSFEERLQTLSAAPTSRDYERIEPNVYGKALMKGMGWSEGKGIIEGGPVEAVQYVPLPGGAGLGYDARSQNGRPMFVKPLDQNGRARLTVAVSEELQILGDLRTGSPVVIVDGPHCGLEGIIRDSPRHDYSVELTISGAVVLIGREQVSRRLVGPVPTILDSLKAGYSHSFVFPVGACCLVASRSFDHGRLYHRQVLVVESDPLTVCCDGKRHTGLSHSDLRAITPEPDSHVTIVVDNEYRNKVGRLLSFNGDSNAAIILLEDDMKAISVCADGMTLFDKHLL